MRLLIIVMLLCSSAFAQGWQQFANTTIKAGSANSVCVPDHFNSAVPGWPDITWYSADLDFRTCDQHMTGLYNGGVYDSKRNRFLTWGGGHNGNQDNSWYAMDFTTVSQSTATCGGVTCTIHSGGASAGASISAGNAVLSRLNDPGLPSSDCPPPNPTAEGASVSLQSYGGLVYLPRSDSIFVHGSANVCATGEQLQTWTVDLTKLGIAGQGNPWTQRASWSASTIDSAGLQCFLDPSYPDEDVVGCVAKGNTFARWHQSTNTWDTGINFDNQMSSGNGATMVVDSKRMAVYSIGPSAAYGSDAIFQFPLSDPATNTDITSQTTGCADAINFPGPGAQYDPALDRIVIYVPQSASDHTIAANHIIIFDPATMTCVEHPQLGGTGPTATTVNTTGGVYGHFQYIAKSGLYLTFVDGTQDMFGFKINKTAIAGLGASTPKCVDRDGDGYGTGVGCTGPDADDLDASVHTATEACTTWGSGSCTDARIKTFLKHQGYNPTNIWYISTTGNDGTGVVNNLGQPFATWAGISGSVACGDAVMLRGGSYSFRITGPSCTAGAPFYILAYPGELPTFDVPSGGVQYLETSYQVMDGIKFDGNNTSGGAITLMGSNLAGGYNLDDFHNIVLRHIEGTGNKWGLSLETGYEITCEDSSFHHQLDEHGIYLTNHDGYDGVTGEISSRYATGWFLRRIVSHDNVRTGVQFNGKVSGAVIEQFIASNNYGAGFSFETGTKNSVIRDSVSINNGKGITINQYQAWCDVYNPTGTCPYPLTGNLFENVTVYSTDFDRDGVTWAGSVVASEVAINAGDPPSTPSSMGSNTWRNIIGVGNAWSGGFAPIYFGRIDDSSTSVFDHVRIYNSFTGHPTNVFYVTGTSGPYYDCPQAAAATSVFATITNCSFGDPLFTALGDWNNITGFDLRLTSSSPSISGGYPMYPRPDVLGTLYSTSPSLGAYQFQGALNIGGTKKGGKAQSGGKTKH